MLHRREKLYLLQLEVCPGRLKATPSRPAGLLRSRSLLAVGNAQAVTERYSVCGVNLLIQLEAADNKDGGESAL
jgi:hypothetical protein